jgi:hypothetical protein
MVVPPGLISPPLVSSRLLGDHLERDALDALKSWRAKSPDLFKKRPKNLPGLDS